jgi:hypothetical protein
MPLFLSLRESAKPFYILLAIRYNIIDPWLYLYSIDPKVLDYRIVSFFIVERLEIIGLL